MSSAQAKKNTKIQMPKMAVPFSWSHGEVQMGTPPASAVSDAGRLVNTFRTPVLIQSIDWRIRTQVNTGLVTVCNFGGLVRCRLLAGKLQITRKFVPIWNYGPVIHDFPETPGGSFTDYLSGNNAYLNYYRWILPRPLLLLPGSAVHAEYQLGASAINSFVNTNVDMTVQGFSLDEDAKLPDYHNVPFIAGYQSPEGQSFAQSTDDDLVNPFATELFLQRFTGRLQTRVAAGATNVQGMFEGISLADGATTPDGDTDVQITDSAGNKISNFTRFYMAFDVARRSFTFNGSLRPGKSSVSREMYQMTLQNVAATDSAHIAMVGWRQERLGDQ